MFQRQRTGWLGTRPTRRIPRSRWGQGGTCSGVVVVGVPHDKGKGKIPVDSGLVFIDF